MATAIIGTVVLGLFAGVLVYMIKQKKKNISACGCSGGCSGCSHSSNCHK